MADRKTRLRGDQVLDRSITKVDLDATGETEGFVSTVQANGSVDWEDSSGLAAVNRNEINIVLNAFRIAVNGSLTQFNMVDGIVDEYEDESGIDTGASTNESYDSVNDLYSPSTSTGLDTSPFTHLKCNDNAGNATVTDDGTGANTVTNKSSVSDSDTSNISVTGKINEGFELNSAGDPADNAGENLNIDAIITDIASDNTGTFAFWIKPYALGINRHIFLAGSSGVSHSLKFRASHNLQFQISAVGGESLNVNFPTDTLATNTWTHIVIVQDGIGITGYVNGVEVTITETDTTLGAGAWFNDITTVTRGRIGSQILGSGSEDQYFQGILDDFRYYQNKALTSDEANVLYNSGTGTEADQPLGATDNMTLISNSFTAEAQADNSRIVLFEEDVDSVILNTDLKAYVSRDNGTTFTQITLVNEGEYESGKNILSASVDISAQPAGTSMIYKLETLNNKDLKIHGSSLNWD